MNKNFLVTILLFIILNDSECIVKSCVKSLINIEDLIYIIRRGIANDVIGDCSKGINYACLVRKYTK